MAKTTIIRDVIHLDIEFDQKTLDIMDTKEFQRLHRIKQLSCEYMVFPTATHTRFSHSIGTYYVMGLLIEQFEKQLALIGYKVDKDDKKLGLLAGLLHDIGHGPFSHTFEKIFHLKCHEKWSIQILNNKNGEIRNKIIHHYGEDFLGRLCDIIAKNYEKEDGNQIFNLISQLVSSQTDADRMDYLLRDSYFTSVSNGNYDLQRLIKSFGVEKDKDGVLRICIREKYISTLEEYVMARYFMHKEVYQHSTKKQMECIMQKIFQRASEVYIPCKIPSGPIMAKLLTKTPITVDEYLLLDDSVLMYHILLWQNSDDSILSFLCKSFLNRNKFTGIVEVGEDIQDKINNILVNHGKKPIVDFKKEYFYLEFTKKVDLYTPSKENIWIKTKGSNKLVDLTEKSSIISKQTVEYQKNINQRRIFISPQLFKMSYGIDIDVKNL